jgi:hypothetical protein
LVSELGPNAFGELPEPGRVDCYLALPLPTEEDEDGPGGVLVVAPRWLLHPGVPQPAGSLVYELATGHPDRQPGELVFPADLTEELRAWPTDSWAVLGVDLEQVAGAVVACWQRGEVRGLHLPLEPGEDPRALVRPAMTWRAPSCASGWSVWSSAPGGAGCTPPAAAGPASASCSRPTAAAAVPCGSPAGVVLAVRMRPLR